jgi:DNA-binding transcriptional MerR regulator
MPGNGAKSDQAEFQFFVDRAGSHPICSTHDASFSIIDETPFERAIDAGGRRGRCYLTSACSRPDGVAMSNSDQELLGIRDASILLGITTRTLRFYEDRGLIEPRRVGAARVYTRRETARMQLILRGKRLGFSLREIREFLDLYDADPHQVEQMRVLAQQCRQRIETLTAQQSALAQTIAELEEMEHAALERVQSSTPLTPPA